jgi:hypothetical protein
MNLHFALFAVLATTRSAYAAHDGNFDNTLESSDRQESALGNSIRRTNNPFSSLYQRLLGKHAEEGGTSNLETGLGANDHHSSDGSLRKSRNLEFNVSPSLKKLVASSPNKTKTHLIRLPRSHDFK